MKDEVQSSAELFADRIDDGIHTARQCAILAYKQGLLDGQSSKVKFTWHDMDELPEKSRAVYLMTGTRKKLKTYAYTNKEEYAKMCKCNSFTKWAYREDIIGL